MIEIYHNPRCRKSRESLEILEAKKTDYSVIKYLEVPLSENKLDKIIKLLKIKPIELIRKSEPIWKENFKNSSYTDKELIQIMVNHPKLMERPIVINGNKAVIGRPPSKILEII